MDVRVRKQHAGSVSTGHVWHEDGAVVTMPYEEALGLVAIPDAGFSIVPDEPEETDSDEQPQVTEPGPGEDLSEVAPEPPVTEPGPARRAAKKVAAGKPEA